MKASAMIERVGLSAAALALAALLGIVSTCSAQERTLEELKAETQARGDRGAYPLEGLRSEEVREALGRLKSLDRDEWAASWSIIGDRYMTKAQSELSSSPAQADKDFIQAWLYYNFARWQSPISPGKQRAYDKSLEAYLAHAHLLDPPFEVVHIPFEGKEIIGYLQMPKGVKPAPLVIAIPGLDRRKEDIAERFRQMLDYGVGYLSLDAPGAGQAPIKAAPGAERMFSRVIDYVYQRPDVDKGRVVVYGASYGAYWSTLLAATERNRLRAVVSQSPAVHEFFQRAETMSLSANREYLFDLVPANLFMFGLTTIDQLADVHEKMSLKTRGFLDKPTAPMLVIGGALDTQVPISDTELLLNSGQTPKEAWINPQGGHMGRDAKGWPDSLIFKRVTMPWILRMVATPATESQLAGTAPAAGR
jgi:esterase FrsA